MVVTVRKKSSRAFATAGGFGLGPDGVSQADDGVPLLHQGAGEVLPDEAVGAGDPDEWHASED